MSENKIKEIMEIICDRMEGRASDISKQDGEYGPVITVSLPSPYEAEKAVGYTISVEKIDVVYLTGIMYIMFTDVPEELFDNVNALLCDVNTGMTLGNFVLAKDLRVVLFNLGLYCDDGMSAGDIAGRALHDMELIRLQTTGVGAWLHRYIKGECSFEDALSALNEDMEDA